MKQTELVKAAIAARIPTLLWGPSGVGKTAQVEQIAKELRMGFVPVAVSTRLAEDFSGLPVPTEDRIEQRPLSWLTRAIDLAESHPEGCIVLLDEFSCAPAAVQAALLSLVQSRYCGDTSIPQSVAFVAAANPVDQAADGWELPLPTISRWLHLDWSAPTVEEWREWLFSSAVKKEDNKRWRGPEGARARGIVCGYLSRVPSALCPSQRDRDRGDSSPYPCPRSWEMAARAVAQVIPARGDLSTSMEHIEALVRGCVGSGPSVELGRWIENNDIPDPEEVLRSPDAWEIPSCRPDRVIATLSGVTSAVLCRTTQDRYNRLAQVVVRAVEHGYAGIGVVMLRSVAADQEFQKHRLESPRCFGQIANVVQAAEGLIRAA